MQTERVVARAEERRNSYDLIIQDLAGRSPPPRVVAIVRAPDGALLRVVGTIYHDRIEDEEHGQVYPFHTFPIESFR